MSFILLDTAISTVIYPGKVNTPIHRGDPPNTETSVTVLTVYKFIFAHSLTKYGVTMSLHSYTKLMIHLIWETNNREKLLIGEAAKVLSAYLFNYSKENKIFMTVNYVNPEHVHSLIDLPSGLSIEECLKLLKGASSHFINQNGLIPTRFSWGRGYAALSVSESQVEKVVQYIKNQKEHHRVKTFAEEYQEFSTLFHQDHFSD